MSLTKANPESEEYSMSSYLRKGQTPMSSLALRSYSEASVHVTICKTTVTESDKREKYSNGNNKLSI
jgi:hypothetical protein